MALIGPWLLVALSAAWIYVLAAEQPAAAPQPGAIKQAAPVPAAIPSSEIIAQAEATIKRLQQIKLGVEVDSALKSIKSALSGFTEKMNRWWESEGPTVTESRSVQRLSNILWAWKFQQEQLDDWDKTLSTWSRELGAYAKDVESVIETWKATQAAVAKTFLAKLVLQRRVEEVLREAQAARKIIQEQSAKIVELQSQVADRASTLAKIRQQIDQARQESSRRLLFLDSPPLWQALFSAGAKESIATEAVESVAKIINDAREFLITYWQRLLLHATVLLLVALGFYHARKNLTAQISQPFGDVPAPYALNRPFASSLLFALLLFPLFYPGAATDIMKIAIVSTVIPVVRLIPDLLPKILRRWIYLLVALFTLDFLYYLLPTDRLLTRVLLLAIAAVGCAGMGLFLRSKKENLAVLGSRIDAVIGLVRFGLFLFAVSVAANIVGNLSLAELLMVAPLRSAYLAVLIYLSARLLMTVTLVALHTAPGRLLLSVRDHSELLALRVRSIIRVVAVVLWIIGSLQIIGVLGYVSGAAAAFLTLRWNVGAAEISISGLVAFLLVLLGAILLSRLLRFVLAEEILPRIRLSRGVPGALEMLSRYGVLLFGFVLALATAGVDLSKLTLLASALGVGIGFGLQNVVNNFVSGLILVFEHPVQVGDIIEVGAHFGEVQKIGFRTSIIRTTDGADVIIPNGELTGARVVNWSLSRQLRRVSISVAVGHGTDPDRVIGILTTVAREHPDVLTNPAPQAVLEQFAERALNYTLLCWAPIEMFIRVRSELTIAINNAFKEAGIQIPFSARDVRVLWPDGSVSETGLQERAKESTSKGGEDAARPVNLAAQERVAKR